MDDLVVKQASGTQFEFVGENIAIKTFGKDTHGKYSLMHWVSAPGMVAAPHTHEEYEETFYILDGELEFVLGTDSVRARAGDFVRVPPNVRHGYRNNSEQPTTMLVSFAPGGMEELFLKYRTDVGNEIDLQSYLEEAARDHKTTYEME